jgi:CO dehydrogenase/acetyl-CoA synthase beta subunit
MEKAYDLKDLAEKLKAKGLPVLEDTAEKVYEAVKEWAQESAVVSENKVDDMVMPLAFPMLDKVVVPALNKIDGNKDA